MTDSRPVSEGAAVASDVGGTFIDLVMVDPATGEVAIEKQPATPDALVDELLTALHRLPRPVAEIDRFIHGATVAINTVVQRRRARMSSDGDAAVDDESTRRAREITPRE
jgi:N-methylhydantoinase A